MADRGPRRLRAGLVAGGLALAVAAVGVVAVVGLFGDDDRTDGTDVGAAVRDIAGARGTTAALTFGDRHGALVDAEFTVTADGLGAGVVSDPGGGRAEVRTNGTRTVVRADVGWWSRRAPGQASALADRWILPEDGLILPIDITRALTPKGVAESVRFAAAGHPKIGGTVPWRGKDADVIDNDDWLLLVTREEPRTVVWFGGHLTGFGPLQPAARHGPATAAVRPAVLRFGPAYQPSTVPPYVGVALSTPDDAALAEVRAQVGQVLPPPDRAAAADAPEPPAVRDAVRLTAPRFSVQPDDGGCARGQCSWSVRVVNVGDAPCDVTVLAAVDPGPGPRTVKLGVLAPGQAATTPAMTFADPGRTTTTHAQVYCPSLDGLDPAPRQRLAALGLDPSQSGRVRELDPALQTILLGAADAMVRGRGSLPPQDRQLFIGALELSVSGQLIPEVQAITGSGRVENLAALAGILRNASGAAPATEQLAFRRELEFAANLLRNDGDVRLRLDDRSPALADVRTNTTYRLAVVTGEGVLPATGAAADHEILVVSLEPTRPEHDLDRAGFVSLLRGAAGPLCPAGPPAVAGLVLVNRHGEERWTAAQLHELDSRCP
ncbi:hypothetical protein ACQP00_16145 [Dactylosporangium sp. CS-047395]|uniref:hypothetical protein n=1 Tax=Dactylosporangium sp. CS-047395 TaxID=3239936 RepID=UPI003D8E173C